MSNFLLKAKLAFAFKPRVTKILTPIIVVLFGAGSFITAVYLDIRASGGYFSMDFLGSRPPVDPLAGNAVNILAMAYDSYGNDGGKFTNEKLGNANADTNILVHISSDRKSVELISIARDILTDIPECEVTGGGVVPARHGMVNSAFGEAYIAGGDLKSGANCQVKMIEQMTGVRINYSALVDFEGFYEMVKALGGVEMCIPENVGPIEHAGGLTLKAGMQKLNAWQATEYGRARLGIDDGSDISRMKRQQKLLGAMGKEALAQMKRLNIQGIYKFFKALMESIDSSMPMEDMVGLAYSLRDIDRRNIASFTAPIGSAPEYGRLVLLPQAQEMWDALRIDQPLFKLSQPEPSPSGSDSDSSTSSKSESSPIVPKPDVSADIQNNQIKTSFNHNPETFNPHSNANNTFVKNAIAETSPSDSSGSSIIPEFEYDTPASVESC
ncbi:MAG: LCP family protein [Bifidobacteriaceae bacterium]|nr:LCP family protein [Bifidobacteriaceae bacterium]